MDRLSYGHSSLCQESRRLVLDGKMTVVLSERNADPALGLSIQESDSRYFFPHSGSPGNVLCEATIVGF